MGIQEEADRRRAARRSQPMPPAPNYEAIARDKQRAIRKLMLEFLDYAIQIGIEPTSTSGWGRWKTRTWVLVDTFDGPSDGGKTLRHAGALVTDAGYVGYSNVTYDEIFSAIAEVVSRRSTPWTGSS